MKLPPERKQRVKPVFERYQSRIDRILGSGDRSELREIYGRVVRAAERGGASPDDLWMVMVALGIGAKLSGSRGRSDKPIKAHNAMRKKDEELQQTIRDLDGNLRATCPVDQERYRRIKHRTKTELSTRQIAYICTGK